MIVKDFYELLNKALCENNYPDFVVNDNFVNCSVKDNLTKKLMANIVHELLIKVLKEQDKKDWSSTRSLLDIYECSSCVMHIAQCYVKGIIPLYEPRIFGVNELVTDEICKKVIEAIFDKSKRCKVYSANVAQIDYIKKEQLDSFIKENPDAKIIDVREEPNQIVGQNIPLKVIVQNPYVLGMDLLKPFILYCSKGYQSTLAADVLLKAGYINIYVAE